MEKKRRKASSAPFQSQLCVTKVLPRMLRCGSRFRLVVAQLASRRGLQTNSMSIPTTTLRDGATMPSLAYGVGTAWFKCDAERKSSLIASVQTALDSGFTHIDEAEMYQNEETTGEALQQWLANNSDTTKRSDLFITSKVLSVDGPGGIEAVCKRTLSALGCEYLDLYLIHAPFQRDGAPFATPLVECWRQMEALVDAGLVRCIGVSNWRVSDLSSICESARIPPCVNQIEAHPYLQQPALLEWCSARGIAVTAYAPLASLTKPPLQGGPIDTPVAAAAAAHGKTPAQVLLRWCLQTGRPGVITTTSKPERFAEYKAIFTFQLSAAEVSAISDAGDQRPRRAFWVQCPQFSEDPMTEKE